MNTVERLIDELCPEGVEFLALGEVLNMRAGQHVSAAKIENMQDSKHIYPCYGGNGVRGFVEGYSHDEHCLLIGRQGALCGNVKRFRGKFYATEHAIVVTPKSDINVDWAFHMLTFMDLNQYASKSAQPGLAVGKLNKVQTPIPSLAVQEEIVKILDNFTKLEAELEAELEARKKQYEHYREALLSFGDEVEFRELGAVCDISTGQAPTTEIFSTTNDFPFINAGLEPSGYLIEKNTRAETITIPSRGQGGAGHVGYQKSEFWCGPLCYRFQSNTHLSG